MPICDCCKVVREHAWPEYRMHNPACLYCGARLIWRLGRMRITVQKCVERRRNALAVWMSHGHPEDELRRLAKAGLLIGPDVCTVSEHPKTKSRSPGRR